MITNDMSWYLILLSAFIVNNVVLMRFLGLCPFFGVSGRTDTSMGMSMAVTFVMTVASAVTWIAWHYILIPAGLEFMRTSVFILVIASLVQLIEMYLKKMVPTLYNSMGIFLPLITTNCAILGLTILNVDFGLGFFKMIVHAIGVSLGFALAILLFSSIRERLESAPIPELVKGGPIIFITAGIMSMAFLGFSHLLGL